MRAPSKGALRIYLGDRIYLKDWGKEGRENSKRESGGGGEERRGERARFVKLSRTTVAGWS